ncbi:no individualized sperm [Glossina fuscipes fuscipes]
MTSLKFRQLIDMSIGSPEPGHVNFYALHCLLSCIAEKLNIIDDTVDFSKYDTVVLYATSKPNRKMITYLLHNYQLKSKLLTGSVRLAGGEDEENPPGDVEQPIGTEEEEKIDLEEKEMMVAESEKPLVPEPEQSGVGDIFVDEEEQEKEPSEKSISSKISLHELDFRVTKLETIAQRQSTLEEYFAGVSVMKDQIEFAITHLLHLTLLTLSKSPDAKRIRELYDMGKLLLQLRDGNPHIEGAKLIDITAVPSLHFGESGLQLTERMSEEGIFELQHDKREGEADQKMIEDHLCYSGEKLLEQLLELKSDFCLLVNKVNEVSARVLKQESQQTVARTQELQEQMKEVKLFTTNLKTNQDRMEMRISHNANNIETIKSTLEDVLAEKVDKSELEILLADKVDYNQLQRKVSLDQMLELQCRIDKKFCEMLRQINDNERKNNMMIEHLKETLGFAAIEGILNTFKGQIEKEIHHLQHMLQTYIDSTNDECAAAGARIKVLQDLACLSCDTTCVMRSMEKAKVAKLPNAHASVLLSPLITYELGSIRKSGIMGFYRKDDFPHAPHAWMNRQNAGLANLKKCVPRHAGGSHTTNTARDRVEKITMNNKK